MSDDRPQAEAPTQRRGRPPMLSDGEVEQLREFALANPLLSTADLRLAYCKESGRELSRSTLLKYLKAAGITRVRPTRTRKAAGPSEAPVPDEPRYTDAHRDEGDDSRYPHGLTDAEWELVRDIFEHSGPGRPPKYTRRSVVDACCYVLRTGSPWRMLPKDLPPWQVVYENFRRWTEANLFEQMHDRLRAMWRERQHREASPTAMLIDAQSVRTSAQGGVKGFDAGKKVKGRKRHLATDTLGLLLAVCVTAASVQDRDAAEPVAAAAKAKYATIEKGWVDAGYGGRVLDTIRDRHDIDLQVVRHPANRNVGRLCDAQLALPIMTTGFTVLPRRWVIERTNGWTDLCRRLAKDNDRLTEVSEAWLWFAHGRLLLRRLAGPHTQLAPPEAAAA